MHLLCSLVFDSNHRFSKFSLNPRPVGRLKYWYVHEIYKITFSIYCSEDNIAHIFHHGIDSLGNWHQLISQHFAFDSIDWLSIFQSPVSLSDSQRSTIQFSRLHFYRFSFFVMFSFETINNSSLLFSSSLPLRLFFPPSLPPLMGLDENNATTFFWRHYWIWAPFSVELFLIVYYYVCIFCQRAV